MKVSILFLRLSKEIVQGWLLYNCSEDSSMYAFPQNFNFKFEFKVVGFFESVWKMIVVCFAISVWKKIANTFRFFLDVANQGRDVNPIWIVCCEI